MDFDQVRAQLNAYGEAAIQWANPGLDISARPTKDWAFASFSDAALIAIAYLVFTIVVSFVMKAIFGSQEPPEKQNRTVLQKFMDEPIVILQALYNPAQRAGYKLICNDYTPSADGMAAAVHVFYLSKIFDFCDTVFIVMRRKWRQLSFLHVYHHTSIFLFYWLNINAAYDGDVYYTVIVNSFIHLVMYFYYFVRTFNIAVPNVLKKMVTNMQLLQFFTMISQAAYLLFSDCPYPKRITIAYFVYIVSLIFLFLDFKSKTYAEGKGARADKKKAKPAKAD